MPKTDFAILSSRIFTGLPDRPWVRAAGIREGRIVALGTDDAVRGALNDPEILSLPGRLVTPGLVDGHCHFNSYGQSLLRVSLTDQPDLASCRERIRKAAAELAPGQWLLGRGWNQYQWSDGREPDKGDLDDILPDNPAMLIRVCGHSEWLNTKALEVVGITRNSPDPPGGRFERDAAGEPTGLLREARHVVLAHIPPPDQAWLRKAAVAAQADALRVGLTGVHTCESLAEFQALARLEREGRLKMRVHHTMQPYNLKDARGMGLAPWHGSDRLWVGHLKLFADGSLGSGTALLHAPYSDEPGNCGLPFLDADQLKEHVAMGHKLGYSVAIHAIGDKAGTNALDAIEQARKRYPGPWRDRVEHVQLHHPRDLERYRSLDVTASVQPIFVGTDWAVVERRWGADRRPYAYGWKTLLERGIRVQFGSDAPVEPIAPILGIQAAVLRQTRDHQPETGWRPDQKLSLEQALSGYFRNAAWTGGKEDRTGSLAPGNLADLTIFSQDLHHVPPESWHEVDVEMTIIDGEIVYRKER